MAIPWRSHGAPTNFLQGKRRLALGGSSRRCGGRLSRGRGRLGLQARIEPTAVNLAVKGLLGLRIDVALADKATESGLNMRTGAAEAVVKVEVPEGCIEVVAPKQGHHAAPQPNAFRIAGRTGKATGGLG